VSAKIHSQKFYKGKRLRESFVALPQRRIFGLALPPQGLENRARQVPFGFNGTPGSMLLSPQNASPQAAIRRK
jgi:hypothetical protein